MLQSFKWIAMVTVFALVLAGCGGTGDNGGDVVEGGGGGGTVEDPATAVPEEETTPSEDPAAEDPASEEQAAEGSSEEELATEIPGGEADFVAAGEPKEIETTIEGSPELVAVTPYTIAAYGISYDLRTDMGAPEVDPGARMITYATQMGDDAAKIVVQVLENTSVNDAVEQMKEVMASEGYGTDVAVQDDEDSYSIPCKMANYEADGYYAGFKVFGIGDHALVVKHSYPYDAGDGMGAVMHEMFSSLVVTQ